MSRLTKEEILSFPKTTYGRALGKTIASKVINELLQYKDLEDQLGCPLEVVFKALKEGIFTKESELDKELELYEVRGIGLRGLEVISKICSYGECDFACYYTDYKKTWWLKRDKSE